MPIAGILSRQLASRLLAAGVLCALVGGGVVYVVQIAPLAPPAATVVMAPVSAGPGPAPMTVPAQPPAPSFDVVRVGPGGTAVLAGRAEPGATVTVTENGAALGQTKADSRGEWVLTPDAPLAPGGRELGVMARSGAGPEVTAPDTVILAVPMRPAPAAGPVMALLVPQAGAARVLSGPASTEARPIGGKLGLDAVDYTDRGDIRFAGSAPPGAPVRVYVDNAPAGDAVADARGAWSLTPRGSVVAGIHQLRVDQLTSAGKVQARVELPFQRSALPAAELAGGRVVVQPGQNLWRLARSAYGAGVHYTVIYLANRDQIRDPRLIYPGQAFALPAGTN